MEPITIAAVIPAYNEQRTIGSVVLKAKLHVDEVWVVDDGSTDDTAVLAEMAGARLIRMPENCGKAEALMAGLRIVAEKGFDAVVMLDADGQHDPRSIPELLRPVLEGQADLVIGSRFIEGRKDIPRYRRAGQTILNKTTSFGAKVHITDTQSGYRALSRRAMGNLQFESEGYSIESAMITYMAEKGMRMGEVPIQAVYDVPAGHKKSPLPHGMGVLNAAVGFIGYRRPLLFFGVPGFVMALFGFVFGLLAMSGDFVFGWGWLFQSIASMMLTIIGIMLMIAGLTLNSLVALMRSGRVRI